MSTFVNRKQCQHETAREHPDKEQRDTHVQCANMYCHATVPKEHFFSEAVKNLGVSANKVCNNCAKNLKSKGDFCSMCEIPKAPYIQKDPNTKKEKRPPIKIGEIWIW